MIRTYFLFLVTTLLLTACGGGGGGGGDTGSGSPPATIDTGSPQTPSNTTTISKVQLTFYVDLYDHSVVLNDAGEGIAYWRESIGNNTKLMVNHYKKGSWGTEQSIGLSVAIESHISLNNTGDAVAVWTERTFDTSGIGIVRHEIWAAHYLNNIWGTPVRISSATPAPVDTSWFPAAPKVTLDKNGNALAVWVLADSNSSTSTSVYYSQFNGTSWAVPQLLSNGTRWVNSVTLNMDANAKGNAIIAWSQNTNLYDPSKTAGWPTPNTWGALFINGSFTTAQLIGDNTLPDYDSAGTPDVSINNMDQSAVVWKEYRAISPQYRVLSRQANASGFATTIDVVDSSTTTTDLLNLPVTRIDNSGNIFYAWLRRPLITGSINNGWHRFYDANSSLWSTPNVYEDSNASINAPMQITTSTTGDFFMLWDDRLTPTSFNPALRLRQYSQASGLATTITSVGFGEEPRMATNNLGESMIVARKAGVNSTSGFTAEIVGIYVPASP